MKFNALIPELTVTNIEKTREFYVDLLGFQIEYERSEEKFMFLSYERSQMMFEEYHEDGWNMDRMEYPFGKGINFSIECANIDMLYQRLKDQKIKLYREMMVSYYETGESVCEQKEFLVQDPDGYLLRFTA